jgi:nucleotide-binding universal stress UspA family protein
MAAAIRRIVCATDLSPASEAAWQEAQLLAGLLKAEILLLHIVPTLPLPTEGYLPPDLYQEVIEAGHRDAREALDRMVASAGDPTLGVTLHLEQGAAAPRILAVAESEAADLIVVGTHGRTGFRRVLLGSVADHVVRAAPCPVVTARTLATGPARLRRIAYATDFSPAARAAWAYVAALADAAGAEVDLIHVTPLPVPDRHIDPAALARMARLLHDQGRAEVEQFLEGHPLPGSRVRPAIVSGVAAEQIAHWAQTRAADLIVMGTHGWSGLVRWMLGSVAHHLVQVAPCPVLTVSPQGGDHGGHHAR